MLQKMKEVITKKSEKPEEEKEQQEEVVEDKVTEEQEEDEEEYTTIENGDETDIGSVEDLFREEISQVINKYVENGADPFKIVYDLDVLKDLIKASLEK